MSKGVSVVICSHNGGTRLGPTVEHLLAQEPAGTCWELVLVDNASTDRTAEYVRGAWTRTDVELRVIHEPRLGTAHARFTGAESARYSYVAFVDDDNWVAPDWLRTAFETMEAHPEVGACGSQTEGVFDREKPFWIQPFLSCLAIGEQCYPNGRVHEALWAAGLIFRREAWREIVAAGFRYRTGRRGNRSLAAGEDNELCYAMARHGWQMRYEPHMKLKHFIPSGRLTWEYVRRMHRANGISSVYLEAWKAHELTPLQRSWAWRVARALRGVVGHSGAALRWVSTPGDLETLALEQDLGRLIALWKLRGMTLASPPG